MVPFLTTRGPGIAVIKNFKQYLPTLAPPVHTCNKILLTVNSGLKSRLVRANETALSGLIMPPFPEVSPDN